MNGRVEERKGDGTAQMPPLFSPSLPPSLSRSLSLFVNGRAERLGRAEMRRLHFYEWGGLRMALRRRGAEYFYEWEEMANEACVCVRESEKKKTKRRRRRRGRGEERRGGGVFFGHKGNVRADPHKDSTHRCGATRFIPAC